VGQAYDANGNQLTASGVAGVMTYDAENRIVAAGGVSYLYDSQNKRVWKGVIDGSGNVTSQEAYFYGLGGQKLGTYSLTVVAGPNLQDANTDVGVYFGSKRIWSNGQVFTPERLGSKGKYFPYGEDRGTPLPNDQVKFATYTRDSATGLDYADQRYYANNFGRFMSPDPYHATPTSPSGPGDPQSCNRYAYTGNDSVNRIDPLGTYYALVASGWCEAPDEDFYSCDIYSFVGFAGGPAAGSTKKKNNTDIRDPDSTDCDPAVIKAMKNAWSQSSNGTTGVEGTFVLVGTPDNFTVVPMPPTNEQMKQSFILPAGAFAIYHVHPNKGDPTPSPADIALADGHDLSMNTISSRGLFEYDPETKTTTQLTQGLDWTKPCSQPQP